MDYVVSRNDNGSLQHDGIKGMHWGIRRFQNEDRTWTEAGKERYNKGGGKRRKHSWEKDRSDNKKTKSKTSDELTPEEYEARSAHRKEVAKKVAIGVGITAAVAVGAALVAKNANIKIKDLKTGDSDDLSSLLGNSAPAPKPVMTEDLVEQGLFTASRGGMAGVHERITNSATKSQEQLQVMIDKEKGILDANTAHLYTVINGSVDNIMGDTLGIKDALITIGEERIYSDRNIDVDTARKNAENSIRRLLDPDSEFAHQPIDQKYLSDVAREYIRTLEPEKKAPAKKWKDITDVAPEDVKEMIDRDMAKSLGMTYEAYQAKQQRDQSNWAADVAKAATILQDLARRAG